MAILTLFLSIYVPYRSYFYACGPFGFIDFILEFTFFISFTLIILFNYFDKRWSGTKRFTPFVINLMGITLFLIYLNLNDSTLENINWRINQSRRKEIVADILAGKLKENSQNLIQINSTIPVSNYGNEISVKRSENGITITFWIDRGLLDTHSEFVFTNCPKQIDVINKLLALYKNNNQYRKIEKNWYRLNNFE